MNLSSLLNPMPVTMTQQAMETPQTSQTPQTPYSSQIQVPSTSTSTQHRQISRITSQPSISKSDPELEAVFLQHSGSVPGSIISQIARVRGIEREHVRIWFHNRRLKQKQRMLKKYKGHKEALIDLLVVQDHATFSQLITQCESLQLAIRQISQGTEEFVQGRY